MALERHDKRHIGRVVGILMGRLVDFERLCCYILHFVSHLGPEDLSLSCGIDGR